MINCECATIAYYPNDFNDEHINVGFLLHDIEKGQLKRCFIKKRQRLKEFDDRLNDKNIDIIFDVINAALNDTFPENNQLSMFCNHDEFVKKSGYFKEIGRMFSNSLRFVNIFSAYADNIDEFFEDNSSLALYFDQDKRPSPNKISTILRNRVNSTLKEAGINSKSSHTVKEEVTFGEPLRFDYYFENILVKIIDPFSGNLSQKINLAKQWAFNIDHYFSNNDLNVIFIVPDFWEENNELCLVRKIFKSVNAQVLTISKFSTSFTSERKN